MVTFIIGLIIGIILGIGVAVKYCIWAAKDVAETDDIWEALDVAERAVNEIKERSKPVEQNDIQRNFNKIFKEP